MATVYKIELELTSHWVAYPEHRIKEIVEGLFENWEKFERNNGNDLQISNMVVKRKS